MSVSWPCSQLLSCQRDHSLVSWNNGAAAPDQDIPRASVLLDRLGHTLAVVDRARRVDFEAERLGQRLDRVVGALLRTICGRSQKVRERF